MSFKGLKQITFHSLLKQDFSSENSGKNYINEIITGVLLLKTLQQLMSISSGFNDDVQKTADEYVNTYKGIAESLEGKYICYKQIKRYIENLKLQSFLQINEKQLITIYQLYQNKTQIKEFHLKEFTPSMYNLGSVLDNDRARLSRVHFKIMVPIVQYYISYFGCTTKDVTVEDVGNRVGSEIKIAISKVRCNQIFSDIERDTMNIREYLHDFDITSDGFIKLLIK